jgi:heat shock protein HtpX
MTRLWNNFKTTALLALLFSLILLIGSQFGQQGLLLAFVLGGAMNIVAFFFSDKIALAAMRGQEVNESTHPDLIEMVSRLSKNAGLPMPRVYVCPQEAPNAFATGRSPSKAAVAVTQGALALLNYDELEGVIGHELAHVKNRDTLISCVAATLAGAISFLGHMAYMMAVMGTSRPMHRDDEEEESRSPMNNPLVSMILLIVAPFAAMLIQLAISRSREFVADEDGSRIAGTPDGLISALRKLDRVSRGIPLEGDNPAFNHLFIVQPLTGESFASLFATHPSMETRIAKLQALRGKF